MSVLTGEQYMKKAEGKINKWMFNDHDAAFELFTKAAGTFKADKHWLRAGDAFSRAGDMSMKLQSQGDACMSYTNSAQMYKRCDMKKAHAAVDITVTLNIERNALGAAARILKEWAEALELDGRPADALAPYKRAHQYFNAEDQPQAANGCLVKMAKIYGETDKWQDAVALYEQLGRNYAEGALKHQAKEQFFRAFLCRCALVNPDNRTEKANEARESLDAYVVADVYLRNTRELEFAEGIAEAVEEGDEDGFDDIIGSMAELKMIDDWKSHVLLAIKKNLDSTR
jgi:alpha-soluble NSF attachment protein